MIDDDLVNEVMENFGLKSKRAAVDFALRAVIGEAAAPITDPWKAALELEGIWANMTDEEARRIWGDEVPDGANSERLSSDPGT